MQLTKRGANTVGWPASRASVIESRFAAERRCWADLAHTTARAGYGKQGWIVLALFALAWFVPTYAAPAESAQAVLVVVAIDTDGEPIARAKVRTSSADGRHPQDAETNESGLARFTVLGNARHDITVSIAGFATAHQRRIKLNKTGWPTVVGVVLQPPDNCTPGRLKICE